MRIYKYLYIVLITIFTKWAWALIRSHESQCFNTKFTSLDPHGGPRGGIYYMDTFQNDIDNKYHVCSKLDE